MIQGRKIANYSLNQILDIKNCTINKFLPQLIHLVDKRPQCIQVYRYSYHRHGYTALTRAQSHSCTYSDILYHNYQQNTLCVCGRVCVVKRTEYTWELTCTAIVANVTILADTLSHGHITAAVHTHRRAICTINKRE